MNSNRNSNPNDIIECLEILQETPEREPDAAVSGRVNFLRDVESLPQPVSPQRKLRLNFRRMLTKLQIRTLTIAIFLISTVFGGGAITARAARSALPGTRLYPIKIIVEDLRLVFAGNDQQRLDLHLEFAAERLEELGAIGSENSSELSDDFFSNLNEHISEAEEFLSSGDGGSNQVDQLDDDEIEEYDDEEDQPDDDDEEPDDGGPENLERDNEDDASDDPNNLDMNDNDDDSDNDSDSNDSNNDTDSNNDDNNNDDDNEDDDNEDD